MQLSEIPLKFSILWGEDAAAGTIRIVPLAPTGQAGAASWESGFPAITFVQTGAGGVPPFGQDFNGAFNIMSAWLQWAQAGGAQPFDATFAAEIGGYPKSCLLPAASQAGIWYNLADNNTANPDTGGSNWVLLGPGPAPAAGVFGATGAGEGSWLSVPSLAQLLGLTGNLTFANGHIVIPINIGGGIIKNLIVNFGQYNLGTGYEANQTIDYDLAFTTTFLGAWVGVQNAATQMIGYNPPASSSNPLNQITIQKGGGGGGDTGFARNGTFIAWGF
jgi:hypothetical protein